MNIRFSEVEIRDLAVAWLALGVAFTIFIDRTIVSRLIGPGASLDLSGVLGTFLVSLLTVGVGFLLHELAHKVVAIRFGQLAEFRADYGMLFFTLMAALAGFLFAAPGAVHHRGRISKRENGIIALAGPITNILLAIPFGALLFLVGFDSPGLALRIGVWGVAINLFLAGFNMIPYGPLDGKTVMEWDLKIYAAVAVPSIILALAAMLFVI